MASRTRNPPPPPVCALSSCHGTSVGLDAFKAKRRRQRPSILQMRRNLNEQDRGTAAKQASFVFPPPAVG